MMHRWYPQFLLILIFAMHGQLLGHGKMPEQEGVWSKEAKSLPFTGETRKLEVHSPDNQKVVVTDHVSLRVLYASKPVRGMEREGVGSLAELAWAPDSNAFYVTESDGGIVGTWDTRVYLVEREKVRRVDVTQQVVKAFKKEYACKEPEEPNIGDIKWLNGSRKLLVAAEVPPHSSCPEMGKTKGFIVAVPGAEIVEELDKKTLMTEWGKYLGHRLVGD